METAVNKLLSILPTPVAAVLMLGGVIFYVLGCVRLGYGAAVRPLVLDLIVRAEQEIQAGIKVHIDNFSFYRIVIAVFAHLILCNFFYSFKVCFYKFFGIRL